MTDALKDFVPYELAWQLKHIGFDEITHAYYDGKGELISFNNVHRAEVKAPTYSQAFRWFREKHNIHSYIEWFDDGKFDYTLTSAKFKEEVCYDDGPFDTEQEAQNACLKQLINEVE
jgi:hypothetical protein